MKEGGEGDENYRLERREKGMRDVGKVIGRRGKAKGELSQLTGSRAKQ